MSEAISNFAHCEALVREADPDRYWAGLFAPADKRPHLYALYAFNFEIARVREGVREALVGEIRLQWWRDALQGEARGDVRANPVAAALDDTIVQFRLPRQSLVDLIDARIFDLYEDPMPSLNDLEGYCGETSSSLIQLSSLILSEGSNPGTADAAGHAGVAYAIAGLLRAFPIHARQGQVYVPADILNKQGVVREDIVTGRGGPGLKGALADLRAVARRHLEQAHALRTTIPNAAKPAFQSIALVEPYLRAMERPDYDPFQTVVDIPQWRRIWALWRGPF
ncbi:phytoene/squalene synthase family protein [Microvirga arabica]|uniref:phytoene/squalene synthase family protein n=1 Tax=Microvirga arabica TaxID=1128671 RepID=UPI001939436A|nr:phytoene/squalene synthase family protein [Microvirga arabica]MBM1173118.1 squalene/phytoene synthase family protein [Microvirga arabica]